LPLILLGISYHTAPVEFRECSALSPQNQALLLGKVAAHALPAVSELTILSTCNRTELYAWGDDRAALIAALTTEWCALAVIEPDKLYPYLFIADEEAVSRHLFEVAAGLDSQVIGEPQILGQVAEAYARAHDNQAVGATLSTLFQRAIQAGKRVRTETALGQGKFSISAIAAAHSEHIFGGLAQVTVLIIGAGEMARGAVAALVRQAADRVLITNHNLDHAQALADEFNGEVVSYTQLGQALAQADLVIAAVAAPHTILHYADIAAIAPERRSRPLVIFDIGLPRNVEATVGTIPNVQLYNLDDLHAATDAHANVRQGAVPQAIAIVDEELKAFQQWQASRAVVPTIQHLRGKAESIRQAELDHLLSRLGDLDPHSRQLIEEFSARLVNKLLHQPTLKLKEKTTSVDSALFNSVVNELFALIETEQSAL